MDINFLMRPLGHLQQSSLELAGVRFLLPWRRENVRKTNASDEQRDGFNRVPDANMGLAH
jgi:hypothetical protein